MEEKTLDLLKTLTEQNKEIIDILKKTYILFSQYDNEYHTEIEREGITEVPKQ
jgi:hypothetical protein